MRGEYRKSTKNSRSKHGTTSACAENTLNCLFSAGEFGNYLRVRGEYCLMACVRDSLRELPPRARRIRHQHITEISQGGTTSACAENTPNHATNHGGDRNYLRVRGEYELDSTREQLNQELPPRARRIPCNIESSPRKPGTTSACAENTTGKVFKGLSLGNYLRVRGEYRKTLCLRAWLLELPPRARRILHNPSLNRL